MELSRNVPPNLITWYTVGAEGAGAYCVAVPILTCIRLAGRGWGGDSRMSMEYPGPRPYKGDVLALQCDRCSLARVVLGRLTTVGGGGGTPPPGPRFQNGKTWNSAKENVDLGCFWCTDF